MLTAHDVLINRAFERPNCNWSNVLPFRPIWSAHLRAFIADFSGTRVGLVAPDANAGADA